jgi:hypothetical protein
MPAHLHVLQADLKPHANHTHGKIITDLDPTAVARLREYMQANQPSTQTISEETMTAQQTPVPSTPVSLPFSTMRDCHTVDKSARSRFIVDHFPAWYAYYEANKATLSRDAFLRLISLSSSTWHNHCLRYEASHQREKRELAEKQVSKPKPEPKPEPTPEPELPASATAVTPPQLPHTNALDLVNQLAQLINTIRAHGIEVTAEVTYKTAL